MTGLPTPDQPDPELQAVADALCAAGYKACVEEGCIQSELDGIPFTTTLQSAKLGFYCFVDSEGLDIDLARVNELNRDIQFAKFALDEDKNLVLAADFIINPVESSLQCELQGALSVWSAALDELRKFIATELKAARNAA